MQLSNWQFFPTPGFSVSRDREEYDGIYWHNIIVSILFWQLWFRTTPRLTKDHPLS